MAKFNRLHLGAGHYFWPGWNNLDEESDLKCLPYDDDSIDDIQAIHLFEHLPRLEVDQFLSEWYRVLKPGKSLVLELPSLDKMAQNIVNGEKNIRLTLLGIYGDPRDWDRQPLMRHEWGWQDWEIRETLENAGFKVKFEEPVFHIIQRDMRVVGEKHG